MYITNLGSKIIGFKVGKKINEDVKNNICTNIAKEISTTDSKRSLQEIYEILNKGKMRYLIPVISRFGICPYGIYDPSTNGIFLREETIESIKESQKVPGTIIHEAIHKLSKLPVIFRGKEIKGFIEGATEYYAYKVKSKLEPDVKKTGFLLSKGNHGQHEIRFNFPPSPYEEPMSIMAQLEIVLGKEKMEAFALHGNTAILKDIQKQYGKDFYEKMRKATNKLIKDDDGDRLILKECQDAILDVCYEKKYREIQTFDDAIRFLQELKAIDNVRGHVKGDTSFKEFYNEKYKEIMQRFNGISDELEPLAYTEPTFKKLHEWSEIKDDLKNEILERSFCYRGDNVKENVARFKNMKRFAMLKDGVLHHVILDGKKPISYIVVSEDSYRKSMWIKEENGRYAVWESGSPSEEKCSYLSIDEDHISITKGDTKEDMRRISMDISKEELEQFSQESTREFEEMNPKSLKERIKEAISRRKALKLNSGENTNEIEKSDNDFHQQYKCEINGNVDIKEGKDDTENSNKTIKIDEILGEK